MSTVGDVGYVDDDGFLYLTDRSTFMIISGGVNIYPQECENLLITHPQGGRRGGVRRAQRGPRRGGQGGDQPMPGVDATPALAEELIAFCGEHLSRQKVPRSVDFIDQMPRLPTGKLYKKPLRDKYWGGKRPESRIVAGADAH
jgi:long-chain acyl-CoA synthetase